MTASCKTQRPTWKSCFYLCHKGHKYISQSVILATLIMSVIQTSGLNHVDSITRNHTTGLQDSNIRVWTPRLRYQDSDIRTDISSQTPGLKHQDTRTWTTGLRYQDSDTKILTPGLRHLESHIRLLNLSFLFNEYLSIIHLSPSIIATVSVLSWVSTSPRLTHSLSESWCGCGVCTAYVCVFNTSVCVLDSPCKSDTETVDDYTHKGESTLTASNETLPHKHTHTCIDQVMAGCGITVCV